MITFDELKKATKKVCRQLEIPIAYLYDADIDTLNTNAVSYTHLTLPTIYSV